MNTTLGNILVFARATGSSPVLTSKPFIMKNTNNVHPLFDILVDALRPTQIVYDNAESISTNPEIIDVDCEIIEQTDQKPNNPK